jgi:hypothetical protein
VNGTLWLLARADGRIAGQHRFPPGHFISTPAASAGRVYAATFAEVVTAFDTAAARAAKLKAAARKRRRGPA